MKKIFCCPALELFHCLPLWKTVLFVSSRAFLLSTPTFLLSTPAENSEATWKKATKCNKQFYLALEDNFTTVQKKLQLHQRIALKNKTFTSLLDKKQTLFLFQENQQIPGSKTSF